MITKQIETHIKESSWIRRMFEIGLEMKAKHGADNVFDFSLGNPDVPSPSKIKEILHDIAEQSLEKLMFGYVPNSGIPAVREELAKFLAQQQESPLTADQIILTCGAAGALNVIFHTVLDRDEEVICPAPYFAEYRFYVENHGGKLLPVKCKPMSFELDIEAIDRAITPKTRAVLLNSPNNPSGRIYSKAEMISLVEIIKKHSATNSRPVFLLSDEPYRFLTYNNTHIPAILPLYDYSIAVSSFSKSHSLAGERIGYIALNPDMPEKEKLLNGLIMANRTLGFVNTPVIGQYMLKHMLDTGVDISIYAKRRETMAKVLDEAGIEYTMPDGAFYFYPKTPGTLDDDQWINLLKEEHILSVPGIGFGYPGYFRLSFCVDEKIIENAADGFKRAAEKARG